MPQLSQTEAADFQQHQTYQENALVIWSITTNMKEFGSAYVARPIVVPNRHPRDEDGYLIARTLDELRRLLPPGLTRMDRAPHDDAVIIETWF